MNIKIINYKIVLKEIGIGLIFIIIFSNIISYLRKPALSSTQLPQLELTLLDGSSYIPKKNKALILHFWAIWCPTCKLEAANIETISKTYEVLTISVNSGEGEKIQNYLNKRGLTFKVVNDKEGVLAKQFHVEAYPSTFIYDANGTLKFSEVGYTSTVGFLVRMRMIED